MIMTHAAIHAGLETLAAAGQAVDVVGGDGGEGAGAWWVTLIPFLPLIAAAFVGILACFNDRSKLPAWTSVALIALSFVLTVLAFIGWEGSGVLGTTAFEWINVSWGDDLGQTLSANFGFYLDGLSLLWMLFVTGLGALIALYASEYMEHDVGLGYCRFFGAFCLFVFSMACLVMADNLLLLFLGWEGVGLCSYLLIGYYHKKKPARDAAIKAFVVNRVGDLGLLLAIFLTFTTFGTIEFAELFPLIDQNRTGAGAPLSETWQVWAIPLLLCCGAFGKSAQIFFYVWLPDAMEGPTPVSALIHAATMVTAGVYLIARMTPLFLADPDLVGLTIVTWSGAITALWSATIAMAQFDIKRIMGYSTISQLGYMFAGLGVLTAAGGVFHVFTHAFFKAVLFLACGAVMHGFAGQLDMRRLSGLWGVPGFKIVTIAMLIGCLNLSGVPFTAGYFSKDMILAEAFATPGDAIWGAAAAGWILLITAGLTAYYTFRVFFRVFVGPTIYEPGDDTHDAEAAAAHAEEEDAHGHGHFHPHGPKWAINSVLAALSVGSIAAAGLYFVDKEHHGWAGGMVHASTAYPGELPWAHHEGETHESQAPGDPAIRPASFHPDGDHSHDHEGEQHVHANERGPAGLARHAGASAGTLLGFDPHKVMYYVSAVFGLAGIGGAFYFHFLGRTSADKVRMDAVSDAIRPVSTWAERKWYVDEFYRFILVSPLKLIAHISHWFDKLVIDGLVDTAGRLPRWGAQAIRPSQSGILHGYATRMIGGVAVVLLIVVLVLQ